MFTASAACRRFRATSCGPQSVAVGACRNDTYFGLRVSLETLETDAGGDGVRRQMTGVKTVDHGRIMAHRFGQRAAHLGPEE